MKFSSNIFTAFLLLILSVGIMKNSVVYLIEDYDQELFVSLFCENTGRPELKCNGKCKLAKLAKEKEQENAENFLKQLESQVFWLQEGFLPITFPQELVFGEPTQYYSSYNCFYIFDYSPRTEKPPEFLL